MKDNTNFREVVELIRKGDDISQTELSDAWGYAADGVNVMYVLCKSLLSGYGVMQETIKRKDALLEAKIKQLQEKDRIIWVLNEKLRRKEDRHGD